MRKHLIQFLLVAVLSVFSAAAFAQTTVRGQLDVYKRQLVNNAGLVIGVDKEHEGNLDEWDIVIDTNVKALLAMTRLVVQMCIRDRGGTRSCSLGTLHVSRPPAFLRRCCRCVPSSSHGVSIKACW